MNKIEVLLKALILLLSEFKVKQRLESIGLVNKLLANTNTDGKPKTFNDEDYVVVKLRLLLESIVAGTTAPNEELLLSLEIALNESPGLLKVIDKYVVKKKPDVVIHVLLKELTQQAKRMETRSVVLASLSAVVSPMSDIDLVIENMMLELDKIRSLRGLNIDGLVDEIDFEKRDSVIAAAKKATNLISGSSTLATGWACFNRLTQGGLRIGITTIAALQHNYKSSFVKSLFLQMVRLNTPKLINPSKIPLMVFISLEEEIDNIMSFFYVYLKYSIDGIVISKKQAANLDPEEVADYVMSKLNPDGYKMRVFRFKPELMTYSVLFGLIEDLEAKGYEIANVTMDYMSKMSREGLIKNGSTGADLLDLTSRVRNFFSAKNMSFLTPAQLSTDAKRLLRSGLSPDEFAQFMPDKGYYKESSALDTELDLEIFLHIVKQKNKGAYLAVQRGKHRIATTIEEEEKFVKLGYSNSHSPIPEDYVVVDELGNELLTHNACVSETSTDDIFGI